MPFYLYRNIETQIIYLQRAKFMRLARLVRVGRMKFIDIGANLTDTMYSGDYNGSNRHPPDLAAVLDRAESAGVVKMMVTGGSLEESRQVPGTEERAENYNKL